MLAYTAQKSPDRQPTVERGGKANNRINADISTESAMITITIAKKILNKGKRAYDDEQVKEILRTLEIMAEQQIITEKYKEEKYYGKND